MTPDIIDVKRLCSSGQWAVKIDKNRNILLCDTVNGERVRIAIADVPQIVECKDCWRRGDPGRCPLVHKDVEGDRRTPIDYSDDFGFCHYGESKRNTSPTTKEAADHVLHPHKG